jgi:hypothetical protein
VFENRMLRRIFGLESDEVSGCWRKMHDKEHIVLGVGGGGEDEEVMYVISRKA